MSFLYDWFQALAPIDPADWALAEPLFERRSLAEGQYLVPPGAVASHLVWVEQGLLRLFYQQDGREKTMLFFSEASIAGDYFSLLSQTSSLRPVQALEDCVLWSLSAESLQQLYQRPAWERMGRRLAEQAYLYAVHRANRLLHDSPATRYQTLLQEKPSLLQRVPQYMIASYLDLTPEALSRVKRRLQTQGPAPPSVHQALAYGLW